MIASSLGAVVLAGVLSAFVMLGRSGLTAANYSEMETQARRAVEQFAADARMATGAVRHSATAITLTVPDRYPASPPPDPNPDNNKVTYAYVAGTGFFLVPGRDPTVIAGRRVLVRGVADFEFTCYDRANQFDPVPANAAIKRIQMKITLRRQLATGAMATQSAVSASFVLRNKPAS
jgi:Tfp pilus assembly protein PilW